MSNNNQNSRGLKQYNKSGIVMLLIGLVCLCAGVFDILVREVIAYSEWTVSIILIIGGTYFLTHKKKHHWIIYIVAVVISCFRANILSMML